MLGSHGVPRRRNSPAACGKRSRQAELSGRACRAHLPTRREIRSRIARWRKDRFLRSAADALHLAAELVVRLRAERKGLAALALTTNPSVLTAAGNDYGFERIFSRQIESLVAANDILVALTTSGNSPNILRGVEAGRARGAYLVALTGETGGALSGKVDLLLNVPSRDPQRIQESHITIGHVVCSLIEQLACG
ncbi:MAG: phosphoheptose isomerase [Acidobacteria bacterium]|nr:MAG: phosphoheptose isomerase [Acidobacteriota bacterium]